MNIRKYYLITSTNKENVNSGDIFIVEGIKRLITAYEYENGNTPVFTYVKIFEMNKTVWEQMERDAHYIIVCGTPQLTDNFNPRYFSDEFFGSLKGIKERTGCGIANLFIGFTTNHITKDIDAISDYIVKHQGEFIKRNYSFFDMVTGRDELTAKVLHKLGFGEMSVLSAGDSTIHINNKHVVSSDHKMNVVMLKYHGEEMKAKMLKQMAVIKEKYFDSNLPTVYVATSANDYHAFYKDVSPILCPGQDEMDKIWYNAKRVLSYRIHASYPMACIGGVEVVNVALDGRSNGVREHGITTIDIDDTEAEFKDVSDHLDDLANGYEARFINRFREVVSPCVGDNMLTFSTRYCGEEYWKANGNSTYNTAVVKLPITEVFADKVIAYADKYLKGSDIRGLELGCAGGYFTHLMNTKHCVPFLGVDISEHAVSEGNKHFGTDYCKQLSLTDLDMLVPVC